MVFLFVLMILLCLADFASNIAINLLKRRSAPRVRVFRARQYRFN